MLNRQTKFGLTFGQILALVPVFASLIFVYAESASKIAVMQTKIQAIEQRQDKQDNDTELRFRLMFEDNKSEFNRLNDKLDKFLIQVK